MASNQTGNYGLNQWEATDQVLRTDFNADNQKIDEAISENAAAITTLTTQLAQRGNCRIETFTYTGTGTFGQANPTRITFSDKPIFFLVFEGEFLMFGRYNSSQGAMAYRIEKNYTVGLSPQALQWSGTQVSFYNTTYASYQGNVANRVYQVVAFYAMDESE